MFSFSHMGFRAGPLGLIVAFLLPVTGFGADQAQTPRNLNDKTVEAFTKIRPLADSKNYPAMMVLLDGILPGLPPTSYDMAVVQNMRAKLFAAQEQYGKAIVPWEKALELGDKFNYFEEKDTLDTLKFLAQLSYQEATDAKVPVAQQKKYATNAIAYLKRYLGITKKVTPEESMLYASMLYNQAVANPEKPDRDILKQVRSEIERGLYLSIAPKEGFYALYLAILQQEADYLRGAEILEFLVKNFPEKQGYWPTLFSFYLNMANVAGEKDPRVARINTIRAINTVERAQKLGSMKTPKDNYNLVTLYIAANQFNKATDLLHAGLRNHMIDSDAKTWGVLGYYYQQADQIDKAIASLKEAALLFPKDGQIELKIGELYRDQNKQREALVHYQTAIRKGSLERPVAVYQVLAYTAYELEEFEVALKALTDVEKFPESAKDTQLAQLKKIIELAVSERGSKKSR
ncbi:MAG: hypothetical protein EXS38_03375 [Opitutus sp.]|nr:hypothetical protein [Opitutus sp.]